MDGYNLETAAGIAVIVGMAIKLLVKPYLLSEYDKEDPEQAAKYKVLMNGAAVVLGLILGVLGHVTFDGDMTTPAIATALVRGASGGLLAIGGHQALDNKLK